VIDALKEKLKDAFSVAMLCGLVGGGLVLAGGRSDERSARRVLQENHYRDALHKGVTPQGFCKGELVFFRDSFFATAQNGRAENLAVCTNALTGRTQITHDIPALNPAKR
jgi:hypothetical protein